MICCCTWAGVKWSTSWIKSSICQNIYTNNHITILNRNLPSRNDLQNAVKKTYPTSIAVLSPAPPKD
jgi:hypothetical protein